jgi:hypothetical protein
LLRRRSSIVLPRILVVVVAGGTFVSTACQTEKKAEPVVAPPPPPPPPPPSPPKLDAIPRLEFNRRAAEHALPVFWVKDDNKDGALDAGELATLWGQPAFVAVDDKGNFTDAFQAAYERLKAPLSLDGLAPDEKARREAVLAELAQGRPTLVSTALTTAEDKAVVSHVLTAALLVEQLHAKQNGVDALASQIPADDTASKWMFFRNQGPFCEAPKTEKDPHCSALSTKPKKVSGIYPASIQTDPKFCEVLEKRKDEKTLLSPFVVVRHKAGGRSAGNAATDDLEAVPYHVAWADDVKAISAELTAAAAAIADPAEAAFKAYLQAAAQAFLDDDWFKADVAWKAMTATNSKWYLRIGPDEVYFEPCSRKAGFHVSFARINQESLAWQKKLDPVKKDMELALAALAGPPYKARDVGFQLPDFIDIVVNAGDSRSATGATIGQSLPNWGPVAESGGRTVAMTNLYTDDDSTAAWLEQVRSVFCKTSMDQVDPDPKHGTLSTVLHEAAHNLGPAHEYKVKGKTDDQIFGGPLASTLEELKAQTSALYFADWLVEKNLLTRAEADKAHLRDVTWAFGHIAQGMKNGEGKPKPYSQLASIQMGFLRDKGVLVWKDAEKSANGADVGCFDVDLAKWKPAVDELGKIVLGIKGRGDKALAEKTRDRYVEDKGAGADWATLRGTIQERWLRAPKASFVYSVVER